MTQAGGAMNVYPAAVRSTMVDRAKHRFDMGPLETSRWIKEKFTSNTAHMLSRGAGTSPGQDMPPFFD